MNKKHIAFNTHLFLPFFLFLAFLVFSILCAKENEIGWSLGFAIFLLLPVFVFVISPIYFVFSEEYVEITYHFGQREQIKWNEIKSIHLAGGWITRGDATPRYVITYPQKEKRLFFVVGEISKTRKTKKLIKKYYKKEIV